MSSGGYPLTKLSLPEIQKVTSPLLLCELAKDSCEIVRRHVARNPNTPSETLEFLLNDQDYWVGWNLAQNPAVSAALLEKLVSRGLFLREVAAHHNTPSKLLIQLTSNANEMVRAAVACNPATPLSILLILAKDNQPQVRLGVARNTVTPQDLLKDLASDPDEKVLRAVARNRNTPKPLKILLKQSFGV